MFDVSTYTTIAEIPDWDQLHRPNDLNLASWWMQISEAMFADVVAPTYIVVRDAGRLLAATACWTVPRPGIVLPPLESPRLFARWQRGDGDKIVKQIVSPLPAESLFPYTLVGSPRGYAQDLLVAADPDRSVAAVAALIEAATEVARRAGSKLLFLPYLDAADTQLALAASPALVATFGITDCFIAPVSTFEAYLDGFALDRRKRIVLQDMRHFEAAGLATAVMPMPEVMRRAPHLFEVPRGHGWSSHDTYTRRGDLLLPERAGDRLRAICAVRGEAIVGFVRVIREGDAYHLLSYAVDPAEDKRARLYFNLAYYAPVRHAAADGVTYIHLGGGSLEVKHRRGCTLMPRWNLALPLEPWSTETSAVVRDCGRSMLAIDRETVGKFADVGEVDAVLGLGGVPQALINP